MINILLVVGIALGILAVPGRSVDPELKPLYTHAVSIVDQYCSFYQRSYFGYQSFSFTESMGNNNVAAYCRKKPFGFEIVVNRDGWSLLNDTDKISLFDHELLHCLFNIQHSENPKDLMYFEMVSLPYSMIEGQFINYVRKACE